MHRLYVSHDVFRPTVGPPVPVCTGHVFAQGLRRSVVCDVCLWRASALAVNKILGPWLLALNVYGKCGLRIQIEKHVVGWQAIAFVRPE
jgi:hypothetical protein